MTNWQKIKDGIGGVEAPLSEVFVVDHDHASKKTVLRCCKEPDLWFQRIDVSPVTDHFCVVCKACDKVGTATSWSWPLAVALWNVSLWNPQYMGRRPLTLADEIEAIDLDTLTFADINKIMDAIKKAPELLRHLVHDAEANRVEKYQLPEGIKQ